MYKQFALWGFVVAGAGGAGEAIAMERMENDKTHNTGKEIVVILETARNHPQKLLYYEVPGGRLCPSPNSWQKEQNEGRKELKRSDDPGIPKGWWSLKTQ